MSNFLRVFQSCLYNYSLYVESVVLADCLVYQDEMLCNACNVPEEMGSLIAVHVEQTRE